MSTIIDDLRKLTFSDLKRFELLNENCIKSSSIIWTSIRGDKNSINVRVNRIDNKMTLSYTINNEQDLKYDIKLAYHLSNLGIGEVGYFLCPITQKKCRTLYFVDGYFVSRYCFKGIYECQTYSKSYRNMKKIFDSVLNP
jgi:hypothetical protein